jgi:hypothetical protein
LGRLADSVSLDPAPSNPVEATPSEAAAAAAVWQSGKPRAAAIVPDDVALSIAADPAAFTVEALDKLTAPKQLPPSFGVAPEKSIGPRAFRRVNSFRAGGKL